METLGLEVDVELWQVLLGGPQQSMNKVPWKEPAKWLKVTPMTIETEAKIDLIILLSDNVNINNLLFWEFTK